ncbi:hypothetical protein BDM02DRAFT_3193054 [Thelephora ganbajun]|uniref:Uncharacterized protein n=1 Tax=Thelephora ganbajun TaxID=370292 RepID=A0ACB6YZG6_THEGA|nr:hypothetical protein BDM02DRAFT_3193054 [Thelephora ganbajun]
MKYDQLIDRLCKKIDDTRTNIQDLAAKINKILHQDSGPTIGVPSIHSPLQEEDYPFIKYWTAGKWNTIQHPKQGTTPEKGDTPVNCLFWEDEHGNIIPPSKRKAVTNDFRGFLNGKIEKGIHVGPLGSLNWDTRNKFCTFMENLHPWLRLCDAHWKVDQIWVNHYTSWESSNKPPQAEPVSLKRKHSTEGISGPSSKKPKTAATEPPVLQCPKPTKKIPTKINPLANVHINPATHIVPVTQNAVGILESQDVPPTPSPAPTPAPTTPAPQTTTNVPSNTSTLGLEYLESIPGEPSSSPTPDFQQPAAPTKNTAQPKSTSLSKETDITQYETKSSTATSSTLSSSVPSPPGPYCQG